MKKLIIGIVFLGVVVVALYLLSGKNRHEISPQELLSWQKNSDNLLSDIEDNQFYIQESIGSVGGSLGNPVAFEGDWQMRFKMMSLTKGATLKFDIYKTQPENGHSFVLTIGSENGMVRLMQGDVIIKEVQAQIFEPMVYYDIKTGVQGPKLYLEIDGKSILEDSLLEFPQDLFFGISLEGQPDNPAAIMIKDISWKR